MMENVTEYYIVPKAVYDNCTKKQEIDQDQLTSVPAFSRKKLKTLLDYLSDKDLELRGLKYPIFEYANYAVRGKHKPIDWDVFVKVISEAPLELLSEKVKREVRKLRRLNGRLVRKESLD